MVRVDPDWERRLAEDPAGAGALLEDMRPLVAHASLLPYVEAYSLVFDLLARLDSKPAITQDERVGQALKEGRQAYLQRRITSEASIGKILFQNGFELAANLGLTDSGDEHVASERAGLLRAFKELSRRLERIRLIALAGYGDPDAAA